jgi:uncharacterized protein (TIGR02466 family)
MSMTAHLEWAFPTPIGVFHRADSESIDRDLAQVILDRERFEASSDRANVGGWHSRDDFFGWPHPAIATLHGWVNEALAHMLEATGGKGVSGRLRAYGWANVSRRGNYHRIHNHPNCAWSGVYYVRTGSLDATRPLSGAIEFLDPRPFVEMSPIPGGMFGRKAMFQPTAGMMLLFPSFLYHFVNTFVGDGERISVAFNVRWFDAPGA